jgi:hypothetical protein
MARWGPLPCLAMGICAGRQGCAAEEQQQCRQGPAVLGSAQADPCLHRLRGGHKRGAANKPRCRQGVGWSKDLRIQELVGGAMRHYGWARSNAESCKYSGPGIRRMAVKRQVVHAPGMQAKNFVRWETAALASRPVDCRDVLLHPFSGYGARTCSAGSQGRLGALSASLLLG